MNFSTKKWIFLKISSLILTPLMLWFIINLSHIYDKDFSLVLTFFSSQPSKLLFSFLLIVAFFHSALNISEIFEDYVQNEKIKNVANKTLYFFAIIIPLFTFIIIFNLG